MPIGPVATTRRTTLTGGLAAMLTVSACDLETLDPRSGPEGDEPGLAPAVDADSTLVDEVLNGISVSSGELAVLRRKRPEVRDSASVFLGLHRAHADALGGLPAAAGPVENPVRGDSMARLRSIESNAQRALAAAAVRAESGALAKLLASMSAGVAQHLAALT